MKRLLYILMLLLPMVVVAHECDSIHIVGSVYDEKGEAIIAAAISIDGTTIETVTDYNGWFELTMPRPTVPLSIKAKGLGYVQKNIQLADSILRNCQYNLNFELLREGTVGTSKYVDISFCLPIYVASGLNLARLRWAIDHMDYRRKLFRGVYVRGLPWVVKDNIDGSNKNTNYYDIGLRDDRILIRTHRAHYPASQEQMYGDSCVGCISVGSDWVFILDESAAECFKRTNEMQTFSYSVIDGVATCFYLEKSRKIQIAK